ncbi:UvrD-helicase domain-containing protein [Acinetobacter nosocomialis]|uniref:UvrD-helicase domain-containing protein n=1 Tax=Acinetobacter nosocomialis TaxID=106654 RepID=UPI001B82C0CD|nr:UvrD-helicase domain-containing protein [Acinetobacter nosocomialis]MBR7689776.1 UvrD-helicase domain-containing protein [Acinetobacter nosocomialis]MBR7728468.1 UvrD-helicase domain-containing protein [Acinetobacter nosocomialis]MBS0034363.1 UvrD-helicase domain-containing protein [Acinetobacter nosocomialis]MDQ8803669.1 UvrD-helicase domain-containing protein [Acinetobacter nosocomialis]MDQ8848932.1 UvrD-helicase domain-containing protein [Acinetobacter nosocomialis]
MNSRVQVSYQPIIDIEFSGLHLIEASAGTGKTYTLSSLMVRIFLEKYLPGQVIATTFTRAAAAELKSRIRARLVETYRYLDAKRSLTEKEILLQAEQESDLLLQHVLKHFATRIAYACERLKLVIDQLDELFVGTLDSFSQKLLREFAFESGKIERAQITDDAKTYSRQLIHDVLREWIQSQPQTVIDALYLAGELKSVDSFVKLVEDSLNFSSAHFKLPEKPTIQFEQLAQLKQLAAEIDISLLEPYYLLDGEHYKHVSGTIFRNGAFNKLFSECVPQLLQVLKQSDSILVFDGSLAVQRELIFKFLGQLADQKVFKKCPAEISDRFYQHPCIQQIQQLFGVLKNYAEQFDQLHIYLKAYLCVEVKKRLPQVLQNKGETTFSQQIRTLSEALKGEQGQRFAVFVQARYPLILVDEFQDTNQDQDDMLASIWRHPERYQKGCMIMVGDRKQAIYGFRGGDMLTFLNAYKDIQAKHGREYKLIHNHRSVADLVEVVDALFQRQIDFGEQVQYDPIRAGTRPHPVLIDQNQPNPHPLRWLMLKDKETEAQQVAWKIRDLLNQSHAGQLYFQKDAQTQILNEDDIAVLSRNHDGLDKVQFELERLGIRVNRPSKRSVFDCTIAQDVGALLTAILHPYDEAKVKRALISRLFAMDLKQLLQLEQTAEGLSQFMTGFDAIRELWSAQGFLVAWQQCLNQFGIWKNLVAVQSKDNERVVVNLRHLTEILSQHSEKYQGAQNLYHWYLRQLQSPLDREWELERRLSSEAGVQLMTIHQSKGLEFKIVFLLGADKPFRENNKTLNFSTQDITVPESAQTLTQRVVAIADKTYLNETELKQHEERALAEQNRLWYVALTRASHRVYALLQDTDGKSVSGLAFWKNRAEPFQHRCCTDEIILEQPPAARHLNQNINIIEIQAQHFPDQRFYSRGKTSFSYLAQHLRHKVGTDLLASQSHEAVLAEDELDQVISVEAPAAQPISWIKSNFPRGTLAGNFLHEIFEHIDFQCSDEWVSEIRRRFKNDYSSLWQDLLIKYQESFPEEQEAEYSLYHAVAEWLQEILSTPLYQGFRLNQLQPEHYLSECPFYLALSDRVLAMKRIHQLFAEYGMEMPELLEARSARYLNGSIDLVYFDGQRYHIADYKSNYLGENLADYSVESIAQSMSLASYWLQAGLYLVALHRYLKVKMQNYDIEQHLGGATYLYLRGMNGEAEQGYYYWQPSTEFVLRLDAILGYFAEDKIA